MGIEPTYPAWKAGVLPLNYTRMKNYYFLELLKDIMNLNKCQGIFCKTSFSVENTFYKY